MYAASKYLEDCIIISYLFCVQLVVAGGAAVSTTRAWWAMPLVFQSEEKALLNRLTLST